MFKIVVTISIGIVSYLLYFKYPFLNIIGDLSLFTKDNNVVAPLLFILVCGFRPVLFFLPSMGLTIISGMLFGVYYGTLYVIIGGSISTIVGFYFARWMGRDIIKKMVNKSKLIEEIENRFGKYGKSSILYMRLFNIPWDIVSYLAGLSDIKFKDFYIYSLIPLIPISFIYTYFGSNIYKPSSPGFIISLILMLMVGSISYFKLRKRRNRND